MVAVGSSGVLPGPLLPPNVPPAACRLVTETKMLTPDGMLVNTARRRVPKSAKPGVVLPVNVVPVPRMKPDSEL